MPPRGRSTISAVAPALRVWFSSLEGWRQAALVSALATSIWVLLIQTPTILLTDRPLSASVVFMTLGVAGATFLAPLWVWGIAFMYQPWLEQPERSENEVLYGGVFAALVQLLLGGLEAAITKVVPSITFLSALPFAAARGVRALSLPSNDPTEVED